MINRKKVVVVMPAYNAAETLASTYKEIQKEIVDEILLVDDASVDDTVKLSNNLGIKTFIHQSNLGYGGNQKTCYNEALKTNADIVIMLHPDYQYPPSLIPSMASMIGWNEFDVVLGSRILGARLPPSGMPLYKYVANRLLTLFQNLIQDQKLSEYHTGYRAFSRRVLTTLPLMENSDDFVFDNEMLAQATYFGFRVGEVSCPARYFKEASSINFLRSVKYGFGVLWTAIRFRVQRWHLRTFLIFSTSGRKLPCVTMGTPCPKEVQHLPPGSARKHLKKLK